MHLARCAGIVKAPNLIGTHKMDRRRYETLYGDVLKRCGDPAASERLAKTILRCQATAGTVSVQLAKCRMPDMMEKRLVRLAKSPENSGFRADCICDVLKTQPQINI